MHNFEKNNTIMTKRFNITGLCYPNEHYMADVSKKLAQTCCHHVFASKICGRTQIVVWSKSP